MPLLVCPFESQKLVITSDTYVARCDLLSFIVSLLIGNSNPSYQDGGTPESDITSGKSEGTGKEPGHMV